MKGRVKFFSPTKGFGYVVSVDHREFYINVRDVIGAELPRSGDEVEFEPSSTERGPKALRLQITGKGAAHTSASLDTVECPHCKRRVIPRLILKNGAPDRSVCSFCGETIRWFSGYCYIATHVFGDDAPETMTLRAFRDLMLSRSAGGRLLIGLYYRIAPWLVRHLNNMSLLTRLSRIVLRRFTMVISQKLERETPIKFVNQRDSKELGSFAYAPRLGVGYVAVLNVMDGYIRTMPDGNCGEKYAELLEAGYLAELPLPKPLACGIALDELVASNEVEHLLAEIQHGARKHRQFFSRQTVKLTPRACLALEQLRRLFATLPEPSGDPLPIRTTLALWMHWYSPRQFDVNEEEFERVPTMTRAICLDARRYGIQLLEDVYGDLELH
jgi:cold shock CspA family protein